MTKAVFQPDGDGWRPTELAGSPWSADALHVLDLDEYVFINPDLTVYLHRLPARSVQSLLVTRA